MSSQYFNKNKKIENHYYHEDCKTCDGGRIDFGNYQCFECKGYGSIMYVNGIKEGDEKNINDINLKNT